MRHALVGKLGKRLMNGDGVRRGVAKIDMPLRPDSAERPHGGRGQTGAFPDLAQKIADLDVSALLPREVRADKRKLAATNAPMHQCAAPMRRRCRSCADDRGHRPPVL